ncbi:MAG: glycosyltransferase family 2 protein [Patescibacteria group bacterium]
MKNNLKILIGVVFYNEADKIRFLLEKFKRFHLNFSYKILFLNDGSTDNSVKVIKIFLKKNYIKNAKIISHTSNRGVGSAIRSVINFGLSNNFDICVIMAGNGKDTPLEIPLLLSPIINDNFDYVQGSRFLKGGSFKNLPILRKIMILGFTLFMRIFIGFKFTDSTNGFRAYKLSIFKDRRINIDQNWLNSYELEVYLHYKVITLGYKVKEVPISKDYLANVKNYSKIRPIIDWWKFAKPVFLLKLKLKN